jgi:replicative DNA helicase
MISRQLKALSKELGIPVLAMSQLSRNVENRVGNKPQLSDLRESGAIEQDADIVIFIYRREYYGLTEYEDGSSAVGMADLIVAKHRSGSVGEVRMRFDHEYVRFENPQEIAGIAMLGGGMPQNSAFDQQGGTMIVDSKMNEDISSPTYGGNDMLSPDGDVPF